jgi:hypothetical protein
MTGCTNKGRERYGRKGINRREKMDEGTVYGGSGGGKGKE